MKASGKTSQKVFKWKELVLEAKEVRTLRQRHSFLDRTVRKHHPGSHRFDLLINGRPVETASVDLDRV